MGGKMKFVDWKTVVLLGLALGTSMLLANSAVRRCSLRPSLAVLEIDEVDEVRKAIQRAIPYIEEEGNAWIQEKQCVSCHQIPYMHWALNFAKAKEFEVDEVGLAANNAWVGDWINLTDPNRRSNILEKSTLAVENDAIAALLLGIPYRALDEEPAPKWLETYQTSLVNSQRSDGSWLPRGQLPKQDRSFQETIQVSSMWAMLAIATTGEVSSDSEIMIAAKEHLATRLSGSSTEWLAARMLFEHTFGAEKRVAVLRDKLLDAQNQDGGWGWLLDDHSDAFGTGVAIYVLQQVGVSVEEPAITKAQHYLMDTQMDDGSWSVNGTKTADREHPTATATYWGTCWAVIGLLETLPIAE